MLDLYIKRIIIHQFSPNDTELVLAEGPLEITPRLDEYFLKKLSKVFSDEAKRGYFDAENVFISHLGDDLMESSVKIAQLWKEELSFLKIKRPMIWSLFSLTKKGKSILLSCVLLSRIV